MAARGRYARVSQVDRERLIEAFEGNEQDYFELAVNLNINKSTTRSIVATYLRTGRRETLARGATHNKMDDKIRNYLQSILDANLILTLLQMKASLSEHLPEKPGVSTATIARALDGMMMITLKLVEDVPDAFINASSAEWFLQHGVLVHLVFIDETGYNVWT